MTTSIQGRRWHLSANEGSLELRVLNPRILSSSSSTCLRKMDGLEMLWEGDLLVREDASA